ncbi:MAG: class I SAM-dependent methyltransferase [Bordetella sp.]|nr:class I SAM-dependent methyltransferase [Bordetella sp.]
MKIRQSLAVACLLALGAAAQAQAQSTPYQPTVGQSGKDVVWVPTPQELVDRMLEMAQITPQDYLVDLGSGDGRTVITAAQRGTRAHGVEFNPDMVELSRNAARAARVEKTATFEQGDIFKTDFSKATVVTLFLLPDLNVKLRPILLQMPPGTRVVSNSFTMGTWRPDETVDVTQQGCKAYCTAYKWIVPARVEGAWKVDGKDLALSQQFQMLEGTLTEGGKATPISNARLDGANIEFTVAQARYVGKVEGNAMSGTIDGGGSWRATRAQ